MPLKAFHHTIEFVNENWPDFEFIDTGLRFAPQGGVRLHVDALSGTVKFSNHIDWWNNGNLTIDCRPVTDDGSGVMTWCLGYNGKFYAWDYTAGTPAWVEYDTLGEVAVWSRPEDLRQFSVSGSPEGNFVLNGGALFDVYIRLTRTTVDDESPLLTRAALLYYCDMRNYGSYITGKLVSYLENLTFRGRVAIRATTTPYGDGCYIPEAQLPVLSAGYKNSYFILGYLQSAPNVAIIDTFESDKWWVNSGSLTNEVVEAEFAYKLDVIASQSLELIQIEKFPVLLLAELTQPVHLMPASEEQFYYTVDPDHSMLVGLCPGVGEQQFTVEILADLYYDSLEIANVLANGDSYSGLSAYLSTDTMIDLPEIGQQMRLSVDGPPTETTAAGNSSGNKVLEIKMKLVFPFPIPRLTVAKKVYTGLVLDAKTAGG